MANQELIHFMQTAIDDKTKNLAQMVFVDLPAARMLHDHEAMVGILLRVSDTADLIALASETVAHAYEYEESPPNNVRFIGEQASRKSVPDR